MTGTTDSTDRAPAGRHRTVALVCVSLVATMAALSYAAVPLYRLFCQVTGYGGTTMKAAKPSPVVLDRTVEVRLDANVARGLSWDFEPVQRVVEVRLGESTLAHYKATNTSDRPVKGTASFNVTPELAGAYFNKIECFCFTEQTLQPGETVDMPVTFFVDPAILDNADTRRITQITLSYTFYPLDGAAQAARTPSAGAGKGS